MPRCLRSILPLSTAHVICEGLGFEAGIDHKFRDAQDLLWLYTVLIAVGAGIMLSAARSALEDSYFFAGWQRRLAAGCGHLHFAAREPARI